MRNLVWRDSKLYFGKRVVGEIVADKTHPNMWRVVRPDGSLSDMVNRTRANDACEVIFESTWGRKRGAHSPLEAHTGDISPSEAIPAETMAL
ncbi:MAG: hypothetical protein C5B58_01405 [Acidobacteria bacterium]|nr:MAG: hypothetical protein C5B58_01405 [Acidobacteriota bacterium]